MFLFHRRILSLPAPTGSLSFQSSRKGTPTYFLFPHLLIVPPAVWKTCLPVARRDKRFARRREITVFDAPVSSIKLPRIVWLNVTDTIAEPPAISIGTMIAPRGAAAEDTLGRETAVAEVSRGNDLKKLSTFLDCSLSPCLIQPTTPLLVLIKYHLIPPVP